MQQELRKAFGNFGTGVAIIAVRGGDQQAYGLTINSFASVSLQPALLSWCLANESDMMARLAASEKLASIFSPPTSNIYPIVWPSRATTKSPPTNIPSEPMMGFCCTAL